MPPMMPRKNAWFYDKTDDASVAVPMACPPPVPLPRPETIEYEMPPPVEEEERVPFVPSGEPCASLPGGTCANEVHGYPTTGPAEYCMRVAASECGGDMDPRNPQWQRRFRNCMVGASGVTGDGMYKQGCAAGGGGGGWAWWQIALVALCVLVVAALLLGCATGKLSLCGGRK